MKSRKSAKKRLEYARKVNCMKNGLFNESYVSELDQREYEKVFGRTTKSTESISRLQIKYMKAVEAYIQSRKRCL